MEMVKSESPGSRGSAILEGMERSLCCKGKSQATVEKYMRDASHYLEYARVKYGSEEQAFRQSVLEEYRGHLLESYKITSVNSMIAGINCLMKTAGHAELRLESCKMQRKAFRDDDCSLSKEDYHELVSAAEAEGNERLSLII